MADVVRAARIGEQVGIIAGLRWRLFRNSLRTFSGRLDLLALILVGALTALFAAGIGAGLGIASYFFATRGQLGLLALPLWAVFSMWQFTPLMLVTSAAAFDFRNLLRFPLRFSVFFLLSLVYGLFDPGALTSLLWTACIATGILLARSDLWPWTLVVLAVFAAMNLVLSCMVFSWLQRLLAHRRARETLLAILLLCILGFQLFTAVGRNWEKSLAPYVATVLPVLQLIPPGLASRALAGAAQGDPWAVSAPAALLLTYALVFGVLLSRRLHAQYRGEDLGVTEAPAVAATASSSSAPLATVASSFLPGPVAAVFEKELRYVFRNTTMILNLILPLILIAFFAIAWSGPRQRPGLLTRSPELAFPSAVAYMFLILAPLAHNSFAFDGRGIQLLFVAPVRFRDVLLGKNLTLGLILAAETVVVWLVVSLLFRPPEAMIVIATFSVLLFAALVHLIVGNWLSLQFPRRLDFGQYRRRTAGVTVLLGLGLQVVLLGLAVIIYLLTRQLGQVWLVAVVFLALSGVTLRLYMVMLDRFDRLAANRREVLTSALAR